MKPSPFDYLRARDAGHAVALLAEHGDDARPLAGGQSLVAMMNFRIARPSALVDLSRCDDLAFVRREGAELRIGAMTRQRDAEYDEGVIRHCPLIAHALKHAGPVTVRHRGTVGGSIANGYPLAHLICVAVCLDARMVLLGPAGERSVAASEFFVGAMSTAVEPGEILREVVFPCSDEAGRSAFREVGNHAGGPAVCMVAMQATVRGATLAALAAAVSGIDDVPLRLHGTARAAESGARGDDIEAAYWNDLAAAGFAPGSGDEQAVYAMDVGASLVRDAVADLAVAR